MSVKSSVLHRNARLAALLALLAVSAGCGRIGYLSLLDAGPGTTPDVQTTPRGDAAMHLLRDTGIDASSESRDAGSEAHADAPHDGSTDATMDAPADAHHDADGSHDARADVGLDAAHEDAALDGPLKSGEAETACMVGDTRCNGACADTTTSATNCGVCGVVCGSSQTCESGVCIDPPYDNCSGTCLDDQNDPKNCGMCGKTCAAGDVCTSGACGCPNMCAGVCVNFLDDKNNCGSCGNKCSVACVDGACSAPLNAQSVCGDACVNLWTDPDNCGMCGKKCPTNGHCEQQGNCTCPIGWIQCGDVCVDNKNDPLNCNTCGTTCGAGAACVAGVCGCPTTCGGVCVDEQTDLNNCGGCGIKCKETCVAGVCDGKFCGAGTVVGEYSEWCGKVDVHNGGGISTTWAADSDCQSGCNQPGVTYCQKFFPTATSFVEIPVDRVLKPFGTQACNVAYTAQGVTEYACCGP